MKLLVFFGIVIMGLELGMLADLVITTVIEKYHGMWPVCTYYCLCGYSAEVNKFWPSNVYRLLKAIRHGDSCLARLMYFAGREISPKWQNFACEEMLRTGQELTKMNWKVYEDLTRSDAGLPRRPFNLDDL